MEKKKCVLYARQSSTQGDVSASVEMQIENCRRLAEEKNLDVVGVFSDLNTSGKTYPTGGENIAANDEAFIEWYHQQTKTKQFRTGLGQVFARLHEIDYIVVDDITRLYRPCKGSFLENYINHALTSNHVEILQVKGGEIDLRKFDSALITTIRNMINDEQIRNCKLKAMQAFKKMTNEGYFPNGTCKAFGTSYDISTREITFKDDFIPLIHMMFDEVEKYTPYNQIIARLQASLNGVKVYTTTFYNTIANPIYSGFMLNSDGELIKCKQVLKPVITLEQFLNVQKIMLSKKHKPNKAKFRFLPFSGLLFCGNCGSKLVSGSEKGRTFYYCKDGINIRKDKTCSHSRLFSDYEDVEGMLSLKRTITPLLVMSLVKGLQDVLKQEEDVKQTENLTLELTNLKSKQVKINQMFIQGLIDDETLEKSLADVKARINEINHMLILNHDMDATTLHLRAIDIRNQVDMFLKGDLDDATYAKALNQTVKRIDSFQDYINVETVYGNVRIDRIKGKRRLFPPYSIKMNGKLDFTFVIKYFTGKKEVLLDSANVKIISE